MRSEKEIFHLALQSLPTPWGPHRQRWPGSAVWEGSVHSGDTQHHAGSSAAPTGCCWTAPAQSHEPPSHSLSVGLGTQHIKHDCLWTHLNEKYVAKCSKRLKNEEKNWILYLLNCKACLLAFWKWLHTEDHWRFCSTDESQDSTAKKWAEMY